jgi:hypothetical protein
METRDILIVLLTAFLLVWFVYILVFVARTLFKKRGAADHDPDESRR